MSRSRKLWTTKMTTLVILIVLILGWDVAWYLAGVKPMFPWHLKKLLLEKTNPPTLIDVRTPAEYAWFHIDGAANMPDLLSKRPAFKNKNAAEPLVIICMTGHRSPMVAYQLKKSGYKQVYNLTWGMVAWKLFGGKTSKK